MTGRIYPGARWMEDNVGSTGLSIALRTRMAMATSAAEHYCTAFRVWDCSACPIYVDEEFVGVFDVCRLGPGNDLRELFTLAISGARAITERLRYERGKLEGEIYTELFRHSWDINLNSTGILSFDKWGKIIHKNELATQFIQLLQQENQKFKSTEQSKGHPIFNYMKNYSEEDAEIFLDGKRYILESKKLKKQNQNLATIILVKPELSNNAYRSAKKHHNKINPKFILHFKQITLDLIEPYIWQLRLFLNGYLNEIF